MGILTALAGLAVAAYGAKEQRSAQKDAEKAQKRAINEQKTARAEQEAVNARQAAEERRQQIREERVRRAQVIQSSANTGVSGSSGEIGAVSNLSNQLGSNIGYNTSQIRAANNITAANQRASDFLSSAQSKINSANQWGQVSGLGLNIFQAGGGFNSIFGSQGMFTQAPAPVETRTPSSRGNG